MAEPLRFSEGKVKSIIQVGERKLSIHHGELMDLSADAIVCPINPELDFKMGLAKIITQAAGKAITKERPLAPEPYGKVVVMPGGKLKAKYIFFTVLYGEKNPDKMRLSISHAVDRAIRYAEFLRLKSIAFPSMGSAKVQTPYDLVAQEMIVNALKYLQRRNTKVKAIFFSAFNNDAYTALIREAQNLAE